jgi:hypothetical protein
MSEWFVAYFLWATEEILEYSHKNWEANLRLHMTYHSDFLKNDQRFRTEDFPTCSPAVQKLLQDVVRMSNRAWNRQFDDPIPLPRGRQLITLKAISVLIMAAEGRGPLLHARIGMMLALAAGKPTIREPRKKRASDPLGGWH